jgi:hypothetical protein
MVMSRMNANSPLPFPNSTDPIMFVLSGRGTMQRKTAEMRLVLLVILCLGTPAWGQLYAGVLGGVSALSGDASSTLSSGSSAFSSYDPKNGGAFELLIGKHLSNYFTVQGNYIWNENALTLSSGSFLANQQLGFEETRSSSQQTLIAAVLVYFRNRDSRLRPYLSIGTGLVHLSSSEEHIDQSVGAPLLPARHFAANTIALHVPVGMDVNLGRGWAFRYTFSETISKNPIDDRLSPSPEHSFKNFLNLFGFIKRF